MSDEIRYEHSANCENFDPTPNTDIDLTKFKAPLISENYQNPFGIKFDSKLLKVPLKMNLG
jgi:hypothetical protein